MLDLRKKKQIKKAADDILSCVHSDNEFSIDILAIVNDLRINLVPVEELDSSISGFSAVRNGKKIIGLVKSDLETERGRFTVAHELGHLTLHQNSLINYSGQEVFFRHNHGPEKYDIKEIEANYFAACILMPEDKLQKCVSELFSSNFMPASGIETLARNFKVSTTAMTVRLCDLGYNLF
ncbi:ImmA/IrrE family metallo-endopeptidase [Bdellovibrio sp.]|uniref:ImmA/IrrE family metallo-endopeptidase n=1 Tax=Bdellovibrio sp. TaxID=28201 RepID=UPI0032215C7C